MTWAYINKCPVCDEPTQEALPKMGDATEVICDTHTSNPHRLKPVFFCISKWRSGDSGNDHYRC